MPITKRYMDEYILSTHMLHRCVIERGVMENGEHIVTLEMFRFE